MKRTIIISLLVVAISMIAFVSCRDNMYSYMPNDNLYKFCAFDSSSYWIYEDSATHQIDSVVAQKLEKDEYITNDYREWQHGKLFTFNQTYKIINSDTTIIQSIQPFVGFAKPDDSGTGLNANELYVIVPSEYDNKYAFSRLNWYYMNISIPSETKYPFLDEIGVGTFRYSQHFDNITINNHTYQDVKRIEYSNSIYTNEPYYGMVICYWANGIGMVRREYHSSDGIVNVRNLIRHNVINVRNQYR